ncbi:MAG: glycoside hydrolase family 3 C-terminal domain-containing protein [Solirubrobacteraceae bacterium]
MPTVTGPATETTKIDNDDVVARVTALSLEQKVRLLTGADFWSLHGEPSVGLRRLVMSDGPAGVRGERWDERHPSVNIPCPTALAATWDPQLVEDLGALLAFEARRHGVDLVLAPAVNLHRTPYGGRHFECFSEDPLLTGRIGSAYVRGLQAGGVGATLKHYVANDSETERMTLDAQVDMRTLRELYLAPFEAIIREAGPWAVMAAYNSVNGELMTESSLLRGVLHDELGFDGLVVSDWHATRSTIAAGRAALDVVMPGPGGPWGDGLVSAVGRGDVSQEAVDDKVARLLRLAGRVGAIEGALAAAPPQFDDAEIAATLRVAAAAGFVLARNEGSALPLSQPRLRRVAVIGPNAESARTMGGGSATVFPPYTVSPLEGLRTALGPAVEVEHHRGVLAGDRIPVAGPTWLHRPGDGESGVEVRFIAADGEVAATEHRTECTFTWLGSLPPAVARIEVHTVLRASDPGTYTIAASGIGRFALSVGGQGVFDGQLELPLGADVVQALMIPPQAAYDLTCGAGDEAEVVLSHEVSVGADGSGLPGVSFQLNLQPPHGTDEEEIERAVAGAGACDAAVVVVGTTAEVESEGFDRASLALPGRQDELVQRVAAANPTTIVVVNAGAPVLLPWAEEVPAILLAWFPGQEFGHALADVLLGRREPGGRLPTTWPRDEDGLPGTRPRDGILTYDEGLFVGYRGAERSRRSPRFPFGHGLGYTRWRCVSLDASRELAPGNDLRVTVAVANDGPRRGREVVQVYASRPGSEVTRPPRWLAGFGHAEAEPGEHVRVEIVIPSRAFEHWDVDAARWQVEPGVFELFAGHSCAELPISTAVTIAPPSVPTPGQRS